MIALLMDARSIQEEEESVLDMGAMPPAGDFAREKVVQIKLSREDYALDTELRKNHAESKAALAVLRATKEGYASNMGLKSYCVALKAAQIKLLMEEECARDTGQSSNSVASKGARIKS